jgi:hypothetical protein
VNFFGHERARTAMLLPQTIQSAAGGRYIRFFGLVGWIDDASGRVFGRKLSNKRSQANSKCRDESRYVRHGRAPPNYSRLRPSQRHMQPHRIIVDWPSRRIVEIELGGQIYRGAESDRTSPSFDDENVDTRKSSVANREIG